MTKKTAAKAAAPKSKATSRDMAGRSRADAERAKRQAHWADLLRAIEADDRQGAPEETAGLWINSRAWGRDYLDALQEAFDRRNDSVLLAMLDAGIPINERLLPTVAAVLRLYANRLPRQQGRPPKLTAADDASVRWFYDWAVTFGNQQDGAAVQHLADLKGVSVDTIRRALKRTPATGE